MALTAKKKIGMGVIFIIFTLVFMVLGQLAGAALFFNLTSIPLEHLRLDSLVTNWQAYQDDTALTPYLQGALAISVLVSLLPLGMTIAIAIAMQEKEEIHGSARFANDMELAKSGLFPLKRKYPTLLLGKMPKGRFKGKFVELDGQTFVGVSAPTGAGKGVGIVLPNMVNYSGSVVNTDIKLENFFKTAGYRQSQGQEVFLFAPDGYATSEADRQKGILRSHRWNPFHYVRRNADYRVGDLLILSNSLYPLTGDGKADIWPASSGKLFLGLSLWMLDTEKVTNNTPTLPYLLSLVGVEGGLGAWMKREIAQDYISADCAREFNTFLSFPDETQGSILANFNAPLAIYSDQLVAKAVSGNDFDFRDVRRKGMTIYVGVMPPNKSRFQGLLNLFFEQLINENTRVIPELDPTLTHQCLLLLDEFPALGRVNQIKESIGFTRQYNLRYMFIYQDISQLEDKHLYGKEGAKNITANLVAEVIYPPKSVTERVKQISETLGTKTVKVQGESISRGKHMSRGRSTSLQRRPLMLPDEIVALSAEKHPTVDISLKTLLLKENQRAFIMDKIIYFEEPEFNARVEYSKANVPTIPLL
ncbi:type IV secretory system conjugative DNA transfer family protein [Shewanella septentrionalis]|uniref:Type IV secretory system conjugative DNA transfer family protein n=1 Tax=Shewanella septentrionalis TaxID=2952223 RepID=A0A9X2WYC9_9GAMM|nr:type IV secretory system conjugative DNA transfer family protein [Shewanella septentrionalis]MCT7947695.1 type IV secretory system conjugative DNA transfer family protein [Shewanella septentrionalis]